MRNTIKKSRKSSTTFKIHPLSSFVYCIYASWLTQNKKHEEFLYSKFNKFFMKLTNLKMLSNTKKLRNIFLRSMKIKPQN